jgi:hypothetical protein
MTKYEEQELKGVTFTVRTPSRFPDTCAVTKPYALWCDTLLAEVEKRRTREAVKVAVYESFMAYMRLYHTLPREHKNHIGTRTGHCCAFQVLIETYDALARIELTLLPAVFAEPAPPTPVPAARVNRLHLGEDLGPGLD